MTNSLTEKFPAATLRRESANFGREESQEKKTDVPVSFPPVISFEEKSCKGAARATLRGPLQV